MSSDILLVRDGDCFRILHGYLRLVAVLSMETEVAADIKGEHGRAMILRTADGLRVEKDSVRLPLLLQE
ncbi:hypothetical protein [Noviherbaspirillum cavernae]|nr:hypothetical protein [Noviherbaspirillum cavernae]